MGNGLPGALIDERVMSDTAETPQTPGDAKHRRHTEDEDPHYHDEDDLPAEEGQRDTRPPAGRKPSRRVPPPRRPRHED